MKAPAVIRTVRLELSPPGSEDAQDIFERYASDPEVTRYLGWPRHRTVADTQQFLAFSADEWRRWPAGPYLIRSRDDGRLLGSTGFTFETLDRAATGYVLAKDAWGRGYATEALTAIVELAAAMALAHLYALCHPAHRASWRVLEKCGFARDATWSRLSDFPNLVPGAAQRVLCYTRSFDTSRITAQGSKP